MERRRRVVSAEEAKLWREAMRGVTPFPDRLPTESAELEANHTPEPGREPAPARPPAVPVPPRSPAGPTQPPLGFDTTPGLDKRTLARLKKGELAIEASLDLHGLTQEAAHVALWRFITGAADRGLRCLLVVTGKGQREGTGVLRAQVPRWLNESTLRPLVLAFAYAQPKHGGEGALYLLLKRRR